MSATGITGFQATLEVDDGGDGGNPGDTSEKFAGLVTFNLPALEASTFDATELDQDDGGDPTPAPDPYERELPTGMIKPGRVKAEFKYTKANYTRLQALLARRGFTFIATSPDDLTSSGATLLYTTFMGFIAKLDEVKFEKTNPVMIPVEIVVQESPSYEDPTP